MSVAESSALAEAKTSRTVCSCSIAMVTPGIVGSASGSCGVVMSIAVIAQIASPAAIADPKPASIQRLRCRREPL